jgi:hypothetical protein
MLQALTGFTNAANFRYIEQYKPSKRQWLRDRKSIFLLYARNAQNGVVVEGLYEPVDFTLELNAGRLFQHPLPPIELLHAYGHQVGRHPGDEDFSVLEKQLELTALDLWLSLVERLRS